MQLLKMAKQAAWDTVDNCLDNISNIVSRVLEWVVFAGMVYVIYAAIRWVATWWTPDWRDMGNYLDIKFPGVIIGLLVIPVLWFFDLITPGSFLRRTSESAMASAILLAAFVLGFFILMASR